LSSADSTHLKSATFLAALDQIADRFETAWKTGKPLAIAGVLANHRGAERLALLVELIKIDLHYRLKQGACPDLPDYEREFPELRGSPQVQELAGYLAQLEGVRQRDSAHGQSTAAAAPDPVPVAIDQYTVVRSLGGGAQSRVYLAFHRDLGHEVAVKLSRRAAPEGAPERDPLLREGRLLAGQRHPGLARVFDFGFYSDRPYLVMEYLHGQTLEQHVRAGLPPPRRAAAALVAQLARTLAVLHRHGITHQDLKPSNILIGTDAAPRILDFGLARLIDAWTEEVAFIGGTLGYMAPEQARCESTAIGPRSDVYALGAVLYFLLVGRAPREGGDFHTLLGRAKRGEWDRAALEATHVPRRLRDICARALSTASADRHAGADELALDLERYCRRRMVALCLASALLLVSGGALAAWWIDSEKPCLPEAPMIVKVWRNRSRVPSKRDRDRVESDFFPLDSVAPLRRDPLDEIKVIARPPRGLYVSVFLIDGAGELHLLHEFAPDASPPLEYPGKDRTAVLKSSPGNECILLVGRKWRPAGVEELRRLWGEGAWPALPDEQVPHILRLESNAVLIETGPRELTVEVRQRPDPTQAVWTRLEEFRRRLRPAFCYFEGLVYLRQP
jgi:predicted Ser/Thr protein kinase